MIEPNASRAAPGHPLYPHLLRKLKIQRADQVWASDTTYIPLAHGFVYRVAVMDWYSRRVLSWRLPATLESDFCVEALQEALSHVGPPEIFDTDHGSQFTDELLDRCIKNSMDGKGRYLYNVFAKRLWRSIKYEEVYLDAYDGATEA